MRSAPGRTNRLPVAVSAVLLCVGLVACSGESVSLPTSSTSVEVSTPAVVVSTEPASSTTTDPTEAALGWGQEMLDVVRTRAYYADRVDFEALSDQLTQRASSRGPESVYGIAYDAVGELRDRHSRFLDRQAVAQLDREHDAAAPSAVPSVAGLDERIGVIELPAVEALP